jgi:crotonobetainyl-CoA:carnitine CoA-transferase CaiB-like acyl-CoA transferase
MKHGIPYEKADKMLDPATNSKTTENNGPLTGVRILDLTSVVLGPIATQILGDYGADIIKVENPEGDLMRANGVSLHPGMSSIFLAINRNKRSIALNLKKPEGMEVLKRLIQDCDVFIHNMRVAAVEKLGLGYEAVAAIKPDVVYCAAPGFGQSGPDRDKPAFDDIIQAACGLASLNSVGREAPDYAPTLVADKTAGMAVVNSVLAALFHRATTGRGQYVEVPMFETMVSFMLTEHLGGLTFDPAPAKAGYARLLVGGRKPAPTADGYIAILPYTADHWVAFFEIAGCPELIEQYGVRDRTSRNAHIVDMYRELTRITRARSTAEWMEICDRLDIPATPIYGIDELIDHPHLQAVGLFEEAVHPTEGKMRYVVPPTRFSATPARVRSQAPLLGQHSGEVLKELGYTEAEIEMMKERGIVREKVR